MDEFTFHNGQNMKQGCNLTKKNVNTYHFESCEKFFLFLLLICLLQSCLCTDVSKEQCRCAE